MTAGRRGVALTPMETRRDVVVQTARLADELGYEVFALPEGWGLDSTPVLAEIALATTRIRLASGVLSVWGRTPATLAMTAATLHEISGGRYVLGLGASTPALAEGFHDVPFVHPADQLAHTVTAVRALLAGEPARLHHTSHARPLRLGLPPAPTVPIWVAALGARTMRVAAELADGWFPALVALDRLAVLVAQLERARVTEIRHPEALTVAAGPLTVADKNSRAARDIAASCIAWYVCAMGDAYAQSLARQGYGADVQAIRAANPHPSPRSGRIPAPADALLEQLAATGTSEQVRAQLERWDAVADIVMIGIPPGLPWPAIETTLRIAAPQEAATAGAELPVMELRAPRPRTATTTPANPGTSSRGSTARPDQRDGVRARSDRSAS
jgi:alkanesulfonate monooxygenase SsuD/methylene tetrahydromethanopterin reductase-like flavin-dependent oxidoreductase (luciferase family)